jgi:hypothetical protein
MVVDLDARDVEHARLPHVAVDAARGFPLLGGQRARTLRTAVAFPAGVAHDRALLRIEARAVRLLGVHVIAWLTRDSREALRQHEPPTWLLGGFAATNTARFW